MTIISIKKAKDRLTALARLVEKGETVVITRNGEPILDLVPHRKQTGLDLAGGREYLRRRGVKQAAVHIPDDFDEPLAEDFLLRPLP
jgi:prevent-host-death family protein